MCMNNFLIAKIRNVIYYESIDDRKHAQYLHILNIIKKESLNNLLPEPYQSMVSIIPSFIKSEECRDIIGKMRLVYKNYETEKNREEAEK